MYVRVYVCVSCVAVVAVFEGVTEKEYDWCQYRVIQTDTNNVNIYLNSQDTQKHIAFENIRSPTSY